MEEIMLALKIRKNFECGLKYSTFWEESISFV